MTSLHQPEQHAVPAYCLDAVVKSHGDVDFGVIKVGNRWHSFSITPEPDGARRARYDSSAAHPTKAEALREMHQIAAEFVRISLFGVPS